MDRGHAQYGELGYGDNGKKSSANPDKCQAREGVLTQQVTPRCCPSTWALLGGMIADGTPPSSRVRVGVGVGS